MRLQNKQCSLPCYTPLFMTISTTFLLIEKEIYIICQIITHFITLTASFTLVLLWYTLQVKYCKPVGLLQPSYFYGCAKQRTLLNICVGRGSNQLQSAVDNLQLNGSSIILRTQCGYPSIEFGGSFFSHISLCKSILRLNVQQ